LELTDLRSFVAALDMVREAISEVPLRAEPTTAEPAAIMPPKAPAAITNTHARHGTVHCVGACSHPYPHSQSASQPATPYHHSHPATQPPSHPATHRLGRRRPSCGPALGWGAGMGWCVTVGRELQRRRQRAQRGRGRGAAARAAPAAAPAATAWGRPRGRGACGCVTRGGRGGGQHAVKSSQVESSRVESSQVTGGGLGGEQHAVREEEVVARELTHLCGLHQRPRVHEAAARRIGRDELVDLAWLELSDDGAGRGRGADAHMQWCEGQRGRRAHAVGRLN
jgi:hypothetical protein